MRKILACTALALIACMMFFAFRSMSSSYITGREWNMKNRTCTITYADGHTEEKPVSDFWFDEK